MSTQQKTASFYNACVVQRGAYIVRQFEEFRFTVLGPNPDAGRHGAAYSGDHLTICTTAGVEDAERIARGLALLDAQPAAVVAA